MIKVIRNKEGLFSIVIFEKVRLKLYSTAAVAEQCQSSRLGMSVAEIMLS